MATCNVSGPLEEITLIVASLGPETDVENKLVMAVFEQINVRVSQQKNVSTTTVDIRMIIILLVCFAYWM